MKFGLGLIRDRNNIDLPPGSWCDARNIILSKSDTISNEEGITNYGIFPSDLEPIGKYLLGNKIILFSYNTSNGNSDIGFIKPDGTYEQILSTQYFEFDRDYPIQAEGQINYLGDEIIAWIDYKNPPRVLNITNLPFELDGNGEITDPDRLNVTLMFQESKSGVIEVTSLNDSGGSILTGIVQFAISYSNEGLSRTDMFNLTRPVPISTSSLSLYTRFQGSEPNLRSSKSVSLSLQQLDTRFDFVHIHVLRRNSGVATLEEVAKLPISSPNQTYTYTGSEQVTDNTLEELLVDRFRYSNAKAITQVNDRIHLGNLKTESSENFMEYFLDLKVNYIPVKPGVQLISGTNILSSLGLKGEARDGFVVHSFPSFMPGEVYALYAAARLKDGTITPAYHIPGRARAELSLNVFEDAEIDPNDNFYLKNESGTGISSFGSFQQDYEAGARKYYQTRPTADNPNADTNMGFWENFDELYPQGYVSHLGMDLQNQPVRHHRFPETNQLNGSGKNTQLNSLGIQISGFDQFPQEVIDKIDSIEVFYARKDFGNSIILAQDITQFNNKQLPTQTNEFTKYFGGNWGIRYRGTNQGSGAGSDWSLDNHRTVSEIDQSRLRCFSFDLRNLPNVNPNYVTYQYKLVGSDLSLPYVNEFNAGGLVERTVEGNRADGTERKTKLYLISDFMLTGSNDPDVTTDQASYLSKVESSSYVPSNITTSDLNNRLSGEHLQIEVANSPTVPRMQVVLRYSSGESARRILIRTPTTDADGFDNNVVTREEVYLYNVCQVRENVFTSFESQDLVSCGVVLKPLTQSSFNIYGGDVNIGIQTYLHYSEVPTFRRESGDVFLLLPEYYNQDDAPFDNGIKVARRFLGYFRSNPTFRHIRPGDANSEFLGPSPVPGLFDLFRRDLAETFAYNDDYSLKADVVNISTHKQSARPEANEFPTRIIRSVLQPRELVEIQWNKFLPGDYYEHQKNRGEIINLEADNDRLIIHCRFGLFITRASDRITGNEADITITSGDLFELPPREIISSDTGYAGLHSPFSAKKCKLGYVFADKDQGKIFIMGESLDEISNRGMRNFFADHLDLEGDAPFRSQQNGGKGIVFEFDERFNRLLVTKKDPASKTFTLSFDPSGKWISFHDYVPDMYLVDRKFVYSFKNSQLFIHNSQQRIFYNQPFTTRIDFVFNADQTMSKVLGSVNWISEVKNGDLNQQRRTFNKIMVYNSYQCSGEINLTPEMIAYVENEWRFNRFMDIVGDRNVPFMSQDFELDPSNINPNLPYFKQRKFIDKYFVIRMFYNNTLSKDIYLYNIDINGRKSAN